MSILIFGHKNPDTDTICSAISYSYLKKQLGLDTQAVRLGELNDETRFALEYFKVETPDLISSLTSGQQVILVDHNEFQQSADGIEEAAILEVVDHHRIDNFKTADPIYYRAEPVGCTATILLKLFKERDVIITQAIAGLLLSAIISDSLLFKSPTCTEEDKLAAIELAKIAQVDMNEYGLQMLKAGASTADKSVETLINLDAKAFTMGEYKVAVAQINTVDVDEVFERQADFEAAIQKEIEANGYGLFVFVVTDILNSDSKVLALGAQTQAIKKAFDVELDNNTAILKGVVSRKKQVVPQLTNVLS